MRSGRTAIAATVTAAVLGLALGSGAADEEDAAHLNRPTMVALDFHDRPIGTVVEAIGSRSGKRVFAHGRPLTKAVIGPDPDREASTWRDRVVTVEAAEPVPFWEAIDRAAAAAGAPYHLGTGGDAGAEWSAVIFDGEGEPPGPACYGGPFRVGLIGASEHRDVLLVRGPWVRFYSSNMAVAADAADLGSAPADGGPLHVDLRLAAEPGLVCRRDGPPEDLEAVDAAGRPRLAPWREDARQSHRVLVDTGGGPELILRIPLSPADDDGGRTLARLRGTFPVIIGEVRPEPALVIPLGQAEGRTFRAGGSEFTVETDRTAPDGRRSLAVSFRLTDEPDPVVASARLAILRSAQFRVVDAGGTPVRFQSGGSGGDDRDGIRVSFEYVPGQTTTGPPTEFRYHDLRTVRGRVPFDFRDIPLP